MNLTFLTITKATRLKRYIDHITEQILHHRAILYLRVPLAEPNLARYQMNEVMTISKCFVFRVIIFAPVLYQPSIN